MPSKHPLTTSTRVLKPRMSATERRAAQVAGLATQQSQLKQEAAERRLARKPVEVTPPTLVRRAVRSAGPR
jgi:hypothetical protein